MGKTRRKSPFCGKNGWRGIKHARIHKLRSKIINRDAVRKHKDTESQQWSIMYSLFHKGYSIDQIRKILIEKHKFDVQTINRTINNITGWTEDDQFKETIKGLVCVQNGYAVPASTPDLEPAFLVEIDLPIYHLASWEIGRSGKKLFQYNGWTSGTVVFSDDKIFKFHIGRDKNNNSSSQKDDYMKNKLELWPNEVVTQMTGDVVQMHLESGMEDTEFNITGLTKLRYFIDVIR